MKIYQSGAKEKRRGFFKRHKHAIIVMSSIILVALVVTLSVVFSMPKKSAPVDSELPDIEPPPVDVPPVKTYMLPMSDGTVGLEYAADRLVYWDTLEYWRTHPAVDFVGEGNVVAIYDGVVTAVDKNTILDGNVVTVTHDDGYVSVYKSLGDDIAVAVGDKVKAGDRLGVTSSSMMSELKTGAHVHLELKKNGKYVDPSTLIPLGDDK